MKKSILKKLQVYMICFGIAMGFIFPVYANFFVTFKDGMLLYFILGCIMAGITVGIVSYLFVKVILLRPLLKVSTVAREIKSKDISGFIDISSNDSVGDIVDGLNIAVGSLQNIIHEILAISRLIEEIINQTDSTVFSKSSLGKIEDSVGIVTGVARNMCSLSQKIVDVVHNGQDSSSLSNAKLQDTTNNVEGLTGLMHSLSENSAKIKEILLMIEDIAGLTNMLSINATIEAARAGEHGKSFGVVANEVRALAKKVSDSTGTIAHAIQLILNDIKTASVFVETIIADVKESNQNSKNIHHRFDEILEITNENISANSNLMHGVKQLNNSFKEIHKAFIELADKANAINKLVVDYQQ